MYKTALILRSNHGRVRTSDPRPLYGKHLRELRRVRGLSQEKLAELADLLLNYVGGLERGERNVSLVNIVKLAHGGLGPFAPWNSESRSVVTCEPFYVFGCVVMAKTVPDLMA